MAAGVALQNGWQVTLIEHMPKAGAKLAVTGKGRCNITNNCSIETFFENVRHNAKFLYSSLNAFTPADAMHFFENELGLPLKTERGGRVFPVSDNASDVVNALLDFAKNAKIMHAKAEKLIINNGEAQGFILADKTNICADAVLVATGGLSYKALGSTGTGYKLAQQAGHSIVKCSPGLVSLVEKGSSCKNMMGLSLRNVTLTLLKNKKPVFKEQGEMLFTHFGISGPLTLSASSYVGDDIGVCEYVASIDLKPALSAEMLDKRLQKDFIEANTKQAAHALDKLVPASMRGEILKRWGVPMELSISEITRTQRKQLVELLKNFTVSIASKGSLEHAVITAGGVNTKEINPKTMQSNLIKNLYFAGEVIDVDAFTGGFNLHIAFCTARAAALAMSTT
jgi:predicted Rossmann fold flavoprotein